MIEVSQTGFAGLMLIKPKVHGDHRGYFFESYNRVDFAKGGIACDFVQDNQSYSKYGTLRGLHFQVGEFAQAKLVRVLSGRVLDVVVDVRLSSETFGQKYAVELSAENYLQLFVPRGFAHGFVVLSESAIFSYKCDNFYSPSNEAGIYYADPELAIDWQVPNEHIIVSDKDKKHATFREVSSNEKLVGHWR